MLDKILFCYKMLLKLYYFVDCFIHPTPIPDFMTTGKTLCRMIFTPILLLMIVCDGCEAVLSAQFKMIRGSLNNCTVDNVQREEDLEYPGNNRRILHVLKCMWENYYKCLLESRNQETKPEIRRLLAGQYTELACNFCLRPFQNYEELVWKYKPLSPDQGINELEYLDLTPELTFTTNKTLVIYNALESLAGLYVCYQNTNVVSVYILEVSKNDTTEMVKTMSSKDEFSINIEEKYLQIYYQWSQWTECNACGRVGKKFKYGTCFVLSKPVSENTNGWESWITIKVSDNFETNENEKENKKISNNSTSEESSNPTNWEMDILEKFSTGIPCASQYLPKSAFKVVRNLKAVKVLMKYCWEPCQETQIFGVFDNCGNIIEWANNTAGVYSVFQKIPQLPHDIERRTIEAEFGTDIIIQCPGCVQLPDKNTSLTNTPITWRINKNIVFPDIVANQSGGRFTIDLVNRIHLKKLRLKDSRIYSCWQKDELVGTVHLNVEKKFKIRFDHHVTLLGIIAIIGVFLFVGRRILGKELKVGNK